MIEIITNISYPAPPPLLSRKKPINLFLPVKLIELAEKETAFPTDGNSQKKKSNVFSFYDNFHEYTVFCDVAMKKCSRNYQEDRVKKKRYDLIHYSRILIPINNYLYYEHPSF